MMIGFDRSGNQVDLGNYRFDSAVNPLEHWTLVGDGHVMRVAVSFLPVIEEVTGGGPPAPPPAPPEPQGDGYFYEPEPVVPEPAPEPTPEPVPEPEGVFLGACTSLPPMSGINDIIHHLVDRIVYRYTPNGWAPVERMPDPNPEPAPVPEPEPDPVPVPKRKKR